MLKLKQILFVFSLGENLNKMEYNLISLHLEAIPEVFLK